jgi:3',5'-cyclic AMP phosphodiesterase CpdA
MLIAQLTDCHIRPPGMAAYRVAETNMLSERALQAIAALRPSPDLVVISGDLTECGLPGEYKLLAEMLKRTLAMPVYVIPGNHDRRENLVAAFPQFALQDGFLHYVIEEYPVRLVMLDTVVAGAAHGELCATRLAFLERALAARPDVPTMIVMHHPPFQCGLVGMDEIALREPARFAAIIARHKQVQRIVCGHHHRPVFTVLHQALVSIAPSVAHQVCFSLEARGEGAFVMEPPGYHLHLWDAANGFVTHALVVEKFPGPFPFFADPDYPGQSLLTTQARTENQVGAA